MSQRHTCRLPAKPSESRKLACVVKPLVLTSGEPGPVMPGSVKGGDRKGFERLRQASQPAMTAGPPAALRTLLFVPSKRPAGSIWSSPWLQQLGAGRLAVKKVHQCKAKACASVLEHTAQRQRRRRCRAAQEVDCPRTLMASCPRSAARSHRFAAVQAMVAGTAAAAAAAAAPCRLAQVAPRLPPAASAHRSRLVTRPGARRLALCSRLPLPQPAHLAGTDPALHAAVDLRSPIALIRAAGLTLAPPLRLRRQHLLRAAAGDTAGSPAGALEALHDAVERGDLRSVQAAIEQLQHPERELDALLARGGGVPQAAIHRAAAAGRETCMKVWHGSWLASPAVQCNVGPAAGGAAALCPCPVLHPAPVLSTHPWSNLLPLPAPLPCPRC